MNLNDNKITELKNINTLKKLKDLWLSNNRIRRLDDLKFLSILKTADFSDNQISHVNWDKFDRDTITKKIWLARNPIWYTL